VQVQPKNAGVRKTRSFESLTICSYRKKRVPVAGWGLPNEPRAGRSLSSLSAT
jgi:hypothetical protein